jgi:hypothetical protein
MEGRTPRPPRGAKRRVRGRAAAHSRGRQAHSIPSRQRSRICKRCGPRRPRLRSPIARFARNPGRGVRGSTRLASTSWNAEGRTPRPPRGAKRRVRGRAAAHSRGREARSILHSNEAESVNDARPSAVVTLSHCALRAQPRTRRPGLHETRITRWNEGDPWRGGRLVRSAERSGACEGVQRHNPAVVVLSRSLHSNEGEFVDDARP